MKVDELTKSKKAFIFLTNRNKYKKHRINKHFIGLLNKHSLGSKPQLLLRLLLYGAQLLLLSAGWLLFFCC